MELLTSFALPRDVFEMLMSKCYYLPFLKSYDEYWVHKPCKLPKAAVFLLSLNFCHILLRRLTLITTFQGNYTSENLLHSLCCFLANICEFEC